MLLKISVQKITNSLLLNRQSEIFILQVRFADDSELCQVHPMITWSYAYQSARMGPWQKYALDRVRFRDRIRDFEEKLKPVLDSGHRDRIFKERFQMFVLPQG